jgi:hypothetical protein
MKAHLTEQELIEYHFKLASDVQVGEISVPGIWKTVRSVANNWKNYSANSRRWNCCVKR